MTRTGVNFINILRASCSYEVLQAAFLYLRFGFGKSTKALLYEKHVLKMLMKSTTGKVLSSTKAN